MPTADLVLTNAEVHTMADPDETASALASRDGELVLVGDEEAANDLVGQETTHVDCGGRVVLPGFVDAHTHLESTGKYLVHADLSAAASREDTIDTLRAEAAPDHDWWLGFGYDESVWPSGRYLRHEDLDRVSEDEPVAAIRVDMHTASLNSVALERLVGEMPPGNVRTEGGEPTGVVVEDAVDVLRRAIEPDVAETRALVESARDRAHEVGITAVHDMVRNSHAPRVYRDLAAAGELDLRVRLNYWSDHLDAVEELGLRTNSGGAFVKVGGIKSFTDGSIGARTAKLSEPYADGDGERDDGRDGERDDGREQGVDNDGEPGDGGPGTGQWVVDPDELRDLVSSVDGYGLQLTIHAIGDAAIEEAITAIETCEDPGGSRHRIEHVELATDDHIERMAAAGIVASCQPNFLQWAGEGGLYDQRIGEARRRGSNRFRAMLDAGVPLAFGSDSMPMDPLLGVHHTVNAPDSSQRLSVTEATRAYTRGAAAAGFDEDRLGTVEQGSCADLVVLDTSPWDQPGTISDIEVLLTVVHGSIVYDGR